MRGALILWLLPALVCAADLKIDHITVAGSSLNLLQANLSAAGIDGSYLELMAPQADADAHLIDRQPWVRFLRENGGPCAWSGKLRMLARSPETLSLWLNERLDQFGEAPCAFVLGANRPGRYHTASQTRWFGIEISWFDSGKLGWRLGFESPEW